ncbi:MotE family protein [Rhizobium sp. RAF56]|uniref:MotE family protein n=1 Tax=Rhizobium sp. RAF56 TaxID=3233062 RepID=UPI003F985F2F
MTSKAFALCRKLAMPASIAMLLAIPGAFAEDAGTRAADPTASQDEIRQFCTNIADPARDQRYLLQKQELERLQADVNARIAEMDKRKAEYEDWLKRRDDFLKKVDDNLVDVYKNMKPDAAATNLGSDKVRVNIVAAILMKLPARQASLILSEMDAERAGMVTNIMSSASNPNTSKTKDPT